jgi:hypothetical protein
MSMSDVSALRAPARVPLKFEPGFSWRAVALVMAEKFGLRGLRIALMIGTMIGYFWWRGCDGIVCIVLYVFAAATVVLLILMVWTAKESLDKFAREHADRAWLIIDDEGVGGEAILADGEKCFRLPWSQFRRIKERSRFWLLETTSGGWLVLPTSDFTPEAWAQLRAHRRDTVVAGTPKR